MEKASKVSEPSGQKSVQEIKEFDMQFQRRQEVFAATKSAIQFLDLTKSESRTFATFSREKLRQYLKNPKQNESNLRNLSKFLYRLSQPYRRLINYNAEMIDLSAMSIIPPADLVQEGNIEAVLESFYETAKIVDKMDLKEEIYKCALIAWREDASFNYVYYDENEGLYIMPLDGDYCKVSSTNYDGTFNIAYDFTYFRSHPECLEYWDKEFQQKYNKYQADNKLRWQELDPAKTLCIKVNVDDPTMCIPPYIALFEQILDLIDLASIQNVKDELSAYMLLVAQLEHMQGSTDPDDFAVDIETAIAYYDKLAEATPECVNVALSPMPINAITFKGNTTEDTDMLARSMENIFATSGGYQVLGSKQSGALIFNAQIMSDTLTALKPLLPQIEHWHNRFLTYIMNEHSRIKYMMVSPYTKKDYKDALLKDAQYGVPVKMAVAALDGYSPLETLALTFLENDCLELHTKWIPLQSSFTQDTGEVAEGTDPIEGGAPKKPESELTDEGSETRDQGKNMK